MPILKLYRDYSCDISLFQKSNIFESASRVQAGEWICSRLILAFLIMSIVNVPNVFTARLLL